MPARSKVSSRTRGPRRNTYQPQLLRLEDRLAPGDALAGLLPWSAVDPLAFLFPGAPQTSDAVRPAPLPANQVTSPARLIGEESATSGPAMVAVTSTAATGPVTAPATLASDRDILLTATAAFDGGAGGNGTGTTSGPGSYTVTLLGQLNLHPAYMGVWGYVDAQGREYALQGTQNGTSIVNVTDPRNPVEVAFIPGRSDGWREIQTYRNYAYVTTEGGGGVQIIDLSNLPKSATLVGTYSATVNNAHTLFIDTVAGRAYINGASQAPSQSRGGMNILDLTQDPTHPVEIGLYTTRYTHDSFVRTFPDGVYAFTSELSSGFSIVDVTDPANPGVLVNQRYPGNFTHNGWLTDDNQFFLTTDETGPGGNLRVWYPQDPGNVFQVGRYSAHPQATIHNIHAIRDFAVAAYYCEGLRVIDMTDPSLPVEAGYYDTQPGRVVGFCGAWGAYPYLPSGNILISDRANGLWVFSFDGTYAGRLRGVVRNASTGEAISGATIRLSGVNTPQTSDNQGAYGIGYIPDTYQLTVSRAGFQTYAADVTLLSATTLKLDINLTPG